MKKIYLAILFTFFFCFITKANAVEEYPDNYVVLCSYASPSQCALNGKNGIRLINNPSAVIFYSDGSYYIDFKDTCLTRSDLVQMYSYSYKLHTLNTKATRLYQAHAVDAISDDTIPVIWNNNNDKENFLKKGICPPNLYYYIDGYMNTEDNLKIVFSNDDLLPEDKKNVSLWVSEHNEFNASEYIFNYSASITSYLKEQFSVMTKPGACPTSEETINLINLFSFNSTVFNATKASAADKSAIAKFMYKSGYLTDVETSIKRYESGGDCYNNNPGVYSELAKAASNFVKTGKTYKDKKTSDIASEEVDCDKIVGKGTFAYYLHTTFRFIQFLGPIIVIVLTTLEYIKVIASGDSDMLKKTNKRTIIRLIFAGLLFVAPIIITTLINAFNVFGSHCEISLF